ncbi:MAG: hypothetical protein M3O91_04075 [Chloroflexota bacterium]|nr:hypothetical protein [Chloroflexota bacterium]
MEEKDGTLSAFRIVDQIKAELPPDVPSGATLELPVELSLLIAIRGGEAGRTHEIGLELHTPDGEQKRLRGAQVTMGGASPGANLNTRLRVLLSKTGRYWFDVLIDGDLVTRVPLMVEVTDAVSAPQPPDQPRSVAQ